jgi:hypothetical protein
VGGGVQTGSTLHVDHLLAYCTCPGWLWRWRSWWNEWQGNPKYSEKTCPDPTLSTTNPTWPDPGLNSGRRGGKPASNRFSYGAALLGRNSSGSDLENREYGRGNPLRWPRDTLYPQELALTSPTRGCRSVGTVRLQTKSEEFFFVCFKRYATYSCVFPRRVCCWCEY